MSVSFSQRLGRYGYDDDGKKDRHHLLWSNRHWQNGYADRLRGHPYLEIYIPQKSLHCVIHQVMTEIPVPEGKLCKSAFVTLESALENSQLSVTNDPPQERLNFLIDLWQDRAPDTVEALIRQRNLFDAYQKDDLHDLRSNLSASKAAHKTALAVAALAELNPDLVKHFDQALAIK